MIDLTELRHRLTHLVRVLVHRVCINELQPFFGPGHGSPMKIDPYERSCVFREMTTNVKNELTSPITRDVNKTFKTKAKTKTSNFKTKAKTKI